MKYYYISIYLAYLFYSYTQSLRNEMHGILYNMRDVSNVEPKFNKFYRIITFEYRCVCRYVCIYLALITHEEFMYVRYQTNDVITHYTIIIVIYGKRNSIIIIIHSCIDIKIFISWSFYYYLLSIIILFWTLGIFLFFLFIAFEIHY